jgi:two-component system sensor histidine kinase/response regulator
MSRSDSPHCRPQELLDTLGGDRAIFLELVEVFERESGAKLGAMQAAAAAADWPLLGRQAHALKGTVGPLAADALVRMLQQIEEDCRAGALADGAARVAAIEAELAAVSADVRQYTTAL